METSQPEMNKTTIEEKKVSETDSNLKTISEVHHHLHAGGFGQGLVAGLAIFGLILFFCDHILGHNLGTYGDGASITQNPTPDTK